ncbi:MAG: hypothetical protein ACYTE3_31455 [Planctomycetota bacterium]|jgi:single-stranded-DNA-specific exonuclease
MLVSSRMQQKHWSVRPTDERSGELAKSLKISPLVAQVLINRGITDAQTGGRFLSPKLTDLIDPEQMPGIAPAVQRLKQAITNREKVTLYPLAGPDAARRQCRLLYSSSH